MFEIEDVAFVCDYHFIQPQFKKITHGKTHINIMEHRINFHINVLLRTPQKTHKIIIENLDCS